MVRKTDKPMVYIVDDEESVRNGFSLLMRSAAISYHVCDSAEQFLKEVEPQQGGCVLLDITMPHLTGLQLQRVLNHRGINLPVIAISARDDTDTCRMARELGARLFLRKPVDDQALLDAIEWVMNSDLPNPKDGMAP